MLDEEEGGGTHARGALTAAPERTESSSGLPLLPNSSCMSSSTSLMAARIPSMRPGGSCWPVKGEEELEGGGRGEV